MKSLLIAKSNLKKFKGLSICLGLLIFISAMFITALCLLQTDFKNNTQRSSNKLHTSDVALISNVNNTKLNEEEFRALLPKDAKDYTYENVFYANVTCKYDGGKNVFDVFFEKEACFDRKISEVEIVKEKKSIDGDYIYLPYQFYTGGKIKLGSMYKIKIGEFEKEYKVKGFVNSTFGGCINMGIVEFVCSDNVYEELVTAFPEKETFTAYINFDNTKKLDAKISKFVSDLKIDHGLEFSYITEKEIVESRAFMGDIFFVILLMVVIVVLIITLLSIYNNITNYLKENMKTLGILKAIGYKSNDIRIAIVLQFSIIMVIGLVLGIFGGYLFIPCISNILIAQSGLPYTVSFNLVSTIAPIILVPLFIYLIIFLSLIKVKKIDAVNALRDTGGSHVFKHNPIALDKAKGNINIVIALKNMFNSLKQNIINFIVIVFVSLLLVTAVTFYENFDRNPKVSLMTCDYSDVFLLAKEGHEQELYDELEANSKVSGVRFVDSIAVQDKDYINIWVYAEDPIKNYKNKDYCYKGSLPKKDNEVCISGKYAKENGYKIGEEITLKAFSEKTYIITGFVQSTNNSGREAVMTKEGLDGVAPDREHARTIYFDVDGNVKKFVDEFKESHEELIEEVVTFDELLESALGTFKALSKSLVLIIMIIAISDIGLVMYMLLKSLIHKRRYEYGILKALGFTSKQLIIQNIISFMPLIILGSIFGALLGYFSMNTFFTLGMQSFGIMKCDLNMPIDLICLGAIFILITSLLAIFLMSRRIKKVEPYKLLIEE